MTMRLEAHALELVCLPIDSCVMSESFLKPLSLSFLFYKMGLMIRALLQALSPRPGVSYWHSIVVVAAIDEGKPGSSIACPGPLAQGGQPCVHGSSPSQSSWPSSCRPLHRALTGTLRLCQARDCCPARATREGTITVIVHPASKCAR